MRDRQHGYIDLGGLDLIMGLAVVGLLALVGLAGWGLWWLVTHVRFV